MQKLHPCAPLLGVGASHKAPPQHRSAPRMEEIPKQAKEPDKQGMYRSRVDGRFPGDSGLADMDVWRLSKLCNSRKDSDPQICVDVYVRVQLHAVPYLTHTIGSVLNFPDDGFTP